MNIKQLEVIAQVAKNGSLSKAASAMGLAQSIVSRYINQIEVAWGDRLFERTGRGMVLSDFGKSVLPEIEALLEQSNRLDEAVRNAAGIPSGVVRVGVVPSLASPIIPALSNDLQTHAPQIKLSITEGLGSRLDELLISGRIDLAVLNRYAEPDNDNEELVGEVKTFLVFKKSHKFANKDTICFSALDGIPLVLPPAPSGLRSILDSYAKKSGININVHMEAESLSAMKEITISQGAMTILPLNAVADEVRVGRLAVAEIVQPRLPRKILIVATHQHALSKAARFTMGRLRLLMPILLEAET